MSGSWQIGDALALSRELAAESVDCIVTSPPYWGLRSYLADDDPGKALEMGAEPTLGEYVERMVVLFRELRRALKPGGTCWLNLGDCYAASGMSGLHVKGASSSLGGGANHAHSTAAKRPPDGLKPKDLCLMPYRVAMALQADGWYLRSHVVWAKKNCMPESITDRPTCAHEAVFLLTKSARYFYDADAVREPYTQSSLDRMKQGFHSYGAEHPYGAKHGVGRDGGVISPNAGGRNLRNVWHLATQPYSGSHYAVMPPALVVPCIKAGCPAKVCVECGAPWVRVVERTSMVIRPGKKDTRSQNRTATSGTMVSPPTSRTIGWRATCEHDAATRPGLVLDPFGGSGTVGEVAESLGRRWLMFDLDARNEALMHKRTAQTSLLGLLA